MSDLDARCFIKKGGALVPADFAADEMLASIPDGKEILVTVRRSRSPEHNRYFFALLRRVVENTEHWSDEEELLDALKLAVGHTERRMRLDGSVYLAPRSISFAAMDEGAFTRFKNRCLYILATKVLGCDPEELMRETDDSERRAA